MPAPLQSEYRPHTRTKRYFLTLYGALTLLSLHWAVVLYVNSSFLEQFFPHAQVGIFYTIGSLFSILSFLLAPSILRKTGNYAFTLATAVLEFFVLIGMAFSHDLLSAALLFIAHQLLVPLILFSLDLFMENGIGSEERTTGGKRGLILTIMSLAGAFAPLLSGILIGDGTPNYTDAYLASALFLFPFIVVIAYAFRRYADPIYHDLAVIKGISTFWHRSDIRNVFCAHFLLQLFFSWMVIYTPIYLTHEIGLSWSEVGTVLFAGLMAYVFLEYPIGVIADKWIGEKEMMALGFLVLAVATSWFTFLESANVGLWMLAMFMTRVGASFLETTTESYFFKHTSEGDTSLISFFRITRPLSNVIGAISGSIALFFLPMHLLFLVLAVLLVPGFFFTIALHDTK